MPPFRGACRAALCLRLPLLARYVFGKKKTDLKNFKSVSYAVEGSRLPVAHILYAPCRPVTVPDDGILAVFSRRLPRGTVPSTPLI